MIKKIKTIIIAEAGVNHNGSLKTAIKMIKTASHSGADFIKFQLFSPENLSTNYAKLPNYVKSKNKKSQLDMLKKLELSKKNFTENNKL